MLEVKGRLTITRDAVYGASSLGEYCFSTGKYDTAAGNTAYIQLSGQDAGIAALADVHKGDVVDVVGVLSPMKDKRDGEEVWVHGIYVTAIGGHDKPDIPF